MIIIKVYYYISRIVDIFYLWDYLGTKYKLLISSIISFRFIRLFHYIWYSFLLFALRLLCNTLTLCSTLTPYTLFQIRVTLGSRPIFIFCQITTRIKLVVQFWHCWLTWKAFHCDYHEIVCPAVIVKTFSEHEIACVPCRQHDSRQKK